MQEKRIRRERGALSTPKKAIESKKVDRIQHRPCTQRIESLATARRRDRHPLPTAGVGSEFSTQDPLGEFALSLSALLLQPAPLYVTLLRREADDLRVLDYDGSRAFKLFRFNELGTPLFYEPSS